MATLKKAFDDVWCRDCHQKIDKGHVILYEDSQAWHYPVCPPKPVEPLGKKSGDPP